MQAVELDIDLEVANRSGEAVVNLADELGLRDVRVLIARDAGIGRGRHLERRDHGRLERLEPKILEEARAGSAIARRERPAERAVEFVAHQVGDPGRAALDDDGVIVGRHGRLGQSRIVQGCRVGESGYKRSSRRVVVQIDRGQPVAGSSLPLDVHVGQRDRARIHRLGELDSHRSREERCVGHLGCGRVVESEGDRVGGDKALAILGHDRPDTTKV